MEYIFHFAGDGNIFHIPKDTPAAISFILSSIPLQTQEYCFSDVLSAIHKTIKAGLKRESSIYVFTAATGKKIEKSMEYLMLAAGFRAIRVNFFLETKTCGSYINKYGDMSRITNGLVINLQDLTLVPGTLVYIVSMANLNNAVRLMKSKQHSREKYSQTQYKIFVDETAVKLFISVSVQMHGTAQNVRLIDTHGRMKDSQLTLSNVSYFVIHKPEYGIWTIMFPTNKGSQSYVAKVSSKHPIEFHYQFLFQATDQEKETFVRAPLSGE